MSRYELKPENVEAVLFNGHNFGQVVSLLGPHLAKAREFRHERSVPDTSILYQVFDVAEMQWLDLFDKYYVIKDSTGAVSVMKKDEFESKWQPERQVGTTPNWFPTPNYPLVPFNPIGGGPIVTY